MKHENKKITSHICNECRKSFSKSRNLQRHIKAVHEVKADKCDLCDKTFGLKKLLSTHIMSVHDKVKKVTVVTVVGHISKINQL